MGKELEERPGRKNWEGKERGRKPEAILVNKMALGCPSQLLRPFVAVLLGYGGNERATAGIARPWILITGPAREP